jgi:fibronectin-binding autotransporter adhesin
LVTIGQGNGPGAVLAPSVGANQPATLTLQSALTFKADGTYTYRLNTRNASADQVIANGVSIETGAQFDFQSLGNRRLPVGTTFIAISNTAGTPISGTFANLPDGSTFTAARNNFQVSYSGGDGNDLTLTVVP